MEDALKEEKDAKAVLEKAAKDALDAEKAWKDKLKEEKAARAALTTAAKDARNAEKA